MNTQQFLNAVELAAALRLSERTVRQYTRDGVIPSIRVGDTYRYDLAQVQEKLTSSAPVRRRRTKKKK